MTETHTPLRLNAGDETRIMEDRPDGVCLPVCDVKCGGMSGRTVKEGEALATRIVQAVNSHHDLIEALRWYADQFCELGTSHECCGRLTPDECSGCKARAAIAKAEAGHG